MNLRQGRIGRQETLCAAAIAARRERHIYAGWPGTVLRTESAYLSMLLSAGLALVAFLFAAAPCGAAGCETLWELLRTGLGGIFGRAAAAALVYYFFLPRRRYSAAFPSC
jgi:hypothetical protein